MTLRLTAEEYTALVGGKDCRTGGTKPKGRYPVAKKEARTYSGIVFDSKGEMERYHHLTMAERAGLIHGLRRQVGYSVTRWQASLAAISQYSKSNVVRQNGWPLMLTE